MGKLTLKIGSGAIDTCLPPNVGTAFELKESQMPKAKVGHRAATGTPIKNHGERITRGLTDQWTPFALNGQVADVRTPLGSVFHIVKS